MRAAGVVQGCERVEQGLQFGEGGGLVRLGAQPGFQVVAAALAAGEPGGEDHAVVGERGGRDAVLPAGRAEGREHDRPVTRRWAVTDRAYREWSSSQVRISVPVPSARG